MSWRCSKSRKRQAFALANKFRDLINVPVIWNGMKMVDCSRLSLCCICICFCNSILIDHISQRAWNENGWLFSSVCMLYANSHFCSFHLLAYIAFACFSTFALFTNIFSETICLRSLLPSIFTHVNANPLVKWVIFVWTCVKEVAEAALVPMEIKPKPAFVQINLFKEHKCQW